MLHPVKDLSPEQRHAIESLLGHAVTEEEAISIKSIRVAAILAPRLSADERKEALKRLEYYFAKADARREPVSEDEEESIINEALRHTRPNYRPVH
jgi:hypothetical protein